MKKNLMDGGERRFAYEALQIVAGFFL